MQPTMSNFVEPPGPPRISSELFEEGEALESAPRDVSPENDNHDASDADGVAGGNFGEGDSAAGSPTDNATGSPDDPAPDNATLAESGDTGDNLANGAAGAEYSPGAETAQ